MSRLLIYHVNVMWFEWVRRSSFVRLEFTEWAFFENVSDLRTIWICHKLVYADCAPVMNRVL